MNKDIICCFCGDLTAVKNAVVLSIRPNIDSEESQDLFGHKECLKSVLDTSVVNYLHPKI